jgi:PIN domain nuclease of toxin-antitoxin system
LCLLQNQKTGNFRGVGSVCEILIKVQIRKLSLPRPGVAYLRGQLAKNCVQILPVLLDHIARLEQIPMHHRDPFDRILIAQSAEEGLPILSTVADGASIRLEGPKGRRELPLQKFYVTPKTEDEREHDLKPNEVLTEIIVPPADDGKWPTTKSARRLLLTGHWRLPQSP